MGERSVLGRTLAIIAAFALTAQLWLPATVLAQTAETTADDGAASAEEEEADETAADEEAEEEEADEAADEEAEEEEESTDIGAPLGLSILGVAAVAGSVGYFIASSDDEALAAEVAATDPSYQQRLLDRSDREGVLGITLVSLGVALLGTATYFWLTLDDGEEDVASEPDVAVAPTFGRGGAGISLSGTF